MCLHFSIGCYNRRWTSRCRHGFHFSITQVLFTDHVHRRRSLQQILFRLVCLKAQVDTNSEGEKNGFVFLL